MVQRDFASVDEAAGRHIEYGFNGFARQAQVLRDPLRLPVERNRISGHHVEHHDAHWRSLHQRFEIGPGALLGAELARVGNRGGRLCGDPKEDLLVLVRELPAARLSGQEEDSGIRAAVTHRRGLEGTGRRQLARRIAGLAHVIGKVPPSQRTGQVA